MKNPRLALMLSLLVGPALAQTIAPPARSAAGSASAAEEEAVVLNPFIVSTEANKGYYASETLSGTQLKSQVRDLANPITILTEEFMRDIGAVNYEEALEFLPSTREYKGDSSDPEVRHGAHRHAVHGARFSLHLADQ
jgi:outer membrane receptor for ferric coprogen and ferric-rhodotorulic acid